MKHKDFRIFRRVWWKGSPMMMNNKILNKPIYWKFIFVLLKSVVLEDLPSQFDANDVLINYLFRILFFVILGLPFHQSTSIIWNFFYFITLLVHNHFILSNKKFLLFWLQPTIWKQLIIPLWKVKGSLEFISPRDSLIMMPNGRY